MYYLREFAGRLLLCHPQVVLVYIDYMLYFLIDFKYC